MGRKYGEIAIKVV